MATIQILGLFHEAEPTAEAIEQLRKLGVPDEKITVMSGIPYQAEMLGRPRPRRRVGSFALIGAILGLLTGLFLTAGIWLLYPLRQGGQPIVPIPPALIVLFELTMLGTMWTSFFAMLGANRLPNFQPEPYDPHITEGHIGVAAVVDESLADQAEKILTDNSAHHMSRETIVPRIDRRLAIFWASVVGIIILGTVLLTLNAYDIIKIDFPTNMADQDSVGFLQGPRLAAPVLSVPIQGPVLIAGQPASAPVPTSAESIKRGQALFANTCAVCHGKTGNGNGLISTFFPTKPADLTGATVKGMPDSQIFLVITQGFKVMPSIAENLSPSERWDVINYVRTLEK